MLDLRKPHLWYPMARALQRRLVYHKGPTNSGKTYNALRAMRSAASGVYCGPLRLLAMEVYDELNAAGTHCNLTTGAPSNPSRTCAAAAGLTDFRITSADGTTHERQRPGRLVHRQHDPWPGDKGCVAGAGVLFKQGVHP